MRVLSTALFATGAFAAVIRDAPSDCFLAHFNELAHDSPCGDLSALTSCFSQLDTSDPVSIADCYTKAGCPSDEATVKANVAQKRCAELFSSSADPELRRRVPENVFAELTTTSPPTYATDDIANIFARTGTIGDACMTTGSTQSKVCDTKDTSSCSTTEVKTSKCKDGKTCSFDSAGEHICMDLQNSLDTAGIIIAIVFGVAIVTGISALTFLCCRERKEQKRMAAKAEATALARAATKKKRAAEVKTPLMSQQRRPSNGPTDPFHDNNRS